jgi:hypothetical protein
MTDERTEVRSLLDAVSADLPPTRLTVNGICAEARRRRRRRWLPIRPRDWSISLPSSGAVLRAVAVVVAVAVLPGLITLALLRGDSEGSDMAGSGPSAPLSRYSQTDEQARRAVPPDRVQLDLPAIVELATDHQTVAVTMRVSACHGPLELRAVSRPADVVITATEDRRRLDDSAGCPGSAVLETLTTRLGQPLGSRPVVDRLGRVIAVLDRAKVAKVTYVPPGYQPDGGCLPVPVDGALVAQAGATPDAGRSAASRPAASCTNQYSRSHPPGRGTRLSVIQYFDTRPPGDGGRLSWGPPTAVRIHGSAAQLRLGREPERLAGQYRYTRQLRWTERGISFTVASGPAQSPALLLQDDELLRVADGIGW